VAASNTLLINILEKVFMAWIGTAIDWKTRHNGAQKPDESPATADPGSAIFPQRTDAPFPRFRQPHPARSLLRLPNQKAPGAPHLCSVQRAATRNQQIHKIMNIKYRIPCQFNFFDFPQSYTLG